MSDENRLFLKTELIRLIDALTLQQALSRQRAARIDEIIRQLEEVNPNPQALLLENQPTLVGDWQIVYSTNWNYTPLRTETVSTWATGIDIRIWQILRVGNAGVIDSLDSVFIKLAAFAEWKMEVEGVWNINDDKTALVKLKTFAFQPTRLFIIPGLKIPLYDFFHTEKLWTTSYLDEDIRFGRDDTGTLFVFCKRM
ncbi:MAG: PAP/fibrillin family protein [Rivularia sp. (in: cyanobacteria)]